MNITAYSMFLSSYTSTLDDKDRLCLPASFRSALKEGQSEQRFVLFRSYTHTACVAFTVPAMERLVERIQKYPEFSDEREDLETGVLADARMISYDKQGRFVLPKDFQRHAYVALQEHQKNQNIIFVGKGKSFEIWNEDRFKLHQDDARRRLKEKRINVRTSSISKTSFTGEVS